MADDKAKTATDCPNNDVNEQYELHRWSRTFDATKACFVFVAAFLVVAILSQQTMARDPDGLYNNSPYKQWFESQHNSVGQYCCNEADGHPYLEDYTMNSDGSVTLHDGRTLPAYIWF